MTENKKSKMSKCQKWALEAASFDTLTVFTFFPEYAAKHKGFLSYLKRAWDQDSEGDSVGRAPRAAPLAGFDPRAY